MLLVLALLITSVSCLIPSYYTNISNPYHIVSFEMTVCIKVGTDFSLILNHMLSVNVLIHVSAKSTYIHYKNENCMIFTGTYYKNNVRRIFENMPYEKHEYYRTIVSTNDKNPHPSKQTTSIITKEKCLLKGTSDVKLDGKFIIPMIYIKNKFVFCTTPNLLNKLTTPLANYTNIHICNVCKAFLNTNKTYTKNNAVKMDQNIDKNIFYPLLAYNEDLINNNPIFDSNFYLRLTGQLKEKDADCDDIYKKLFITAMCVFLFILLAICFVKRITM